MSKKLKIAGVQMDVAFAEPERNLGRMLESMEATHRQGVQLVVFPECALAGYCFDSLEEASGFAFSTDDAPFQKIEEACCRLKIFVVFGFLEKGNGVIYNSAALIGPAGLVGVYRKVHLPFLGVDRFTKSGEAGFSILPIGIESGQIEPLQDTSVTEVKLGLNICYDTSFPESARVLSLLGADLLVLPTNWPKAAMRTAKYIINARSLENQVFFIAVNRVGTEREFDFIGQSRICDCFGGDLAVAAHDKEEIIYAEIEPSLARNKTTINVPGKYELHRFDDRHPEQYGLIVDKN